jgi:hypothetical protein
VTDEERLGRRITIAIAWLAGAPPIALLCVIALMGRDVPGTTWIVRGVMPIALSWLLVQGRRWVRAIAVIGFSLNAAGALTQLFLMKWTLTMLFPLITAAVTHGIAAATLLLSPAVRAFFAFQNRTLGLGLRGA